MYSEIAKIQYPQFDHKNILKVLGDLWKGLHHTVTKLV
jgi:hypothetical protein